MLLALLSAHGIDAGYEVTGLAKERYTESKHLAFGRKQGQLWPLHRSPGRRTAKKFAAVFSVRRGSWPS